MPMLHDLLPKFRNRSLDADWDLFFQSAWPFRRGMDVDVKETERNILVEAELPGFKKDEIQVELDDFSLTIKATRDELREEKQEKYFRRERQYGTIERTILLPTEVISGSSTAKYEDGVLKITLEKRNPTVPARKTISIQ